MSASLDELQDQGYDVLVYRGPITYDGFAQVVYQAPATRRESVLAIVATRGGDPHAAYRIARFLRRSYKDLGVYVPGLCKSAGTLVCIGASELVIGETGELGPIDVQVREQNELFEYRSGLAIPQALDFLQSKMVASLRQVLVALTVGRGLGAERASQIAVNTVVGIFGPIYGKIDPAALGEITRELVVAQDYALRLGGNLRPKALEELVWSYSSHDFVIDSEEAARLFKKVRQPTPDEADIARRTGFGSENLNELTSSPTEVTYVTRESDGKTRQGTEGRQSRADPQDPEERADRMRDLARGMTRRVPIPRVRRIWSRTNVWANSSDSSG